MLTQLDASRSGIDAPDRDHLSLSIAGGVAFGVLLGCWCRMFAHSSSVNGVLANLASPWVAAAFMSGAVVARAPGAPSHRSPRPVPAAIAGAVAGAVSLVVATVVYYGPARTGAFDFSGAVFRTAFWASAGVAAGAVFGASGAIWRTAPHPRLKMMSVVAFGAIVVGEALFLVAAGATRDDAFALPVVLVVGAAGLTMPLMLGPARDAAQTTLRVAVAAVPVVIGGMALASAATVAARAVRAVL